MIGSLADPPLDRTVVGGYTIIGYRLPSQSVQQVGPMRGSVIAITDPAAGAFWHHRGPGARHPLPVTGQDSAERERRWAQCPKLSECHEEPAG